MERSGGEAVLAVVVPRLPAGDCHVWWVSPTVARRELLDLLDSTERARWSRFRLADDRARYLVAHALLRLVLAGYLATAPERISLTTTCHRCGSHHGTPRLYSPVADLEVSVSHAGDRAVVAVARGIPIGVDVERIEPHRDFTRLAGLALSRAQQEVLSRLPTSEQPVALLGYWTRKEALLKATGDGLTVPPSSLTVAAPDRAPALVAWTARPQLTAAVHLADLHPGPGHIGWLAALGAPLRVTERDASGLLSAAAEPVAPRLPTATPARRR